MAADQWGMSMIRAPQAHARTLGSRAVTVGIIDSGIDSHPRRLHRHRHARRGLERDCALGHVSRARVADALGASRRARASDDGFHGTHVAGIVAAQQNGVGVTGVAPGVTLVPIQVCDVEVCWWSAAIDGITYAGDKHLNVINMSFYADDATTTSGPLTDCDPNDTATVAAVDRAIAYARSRGVTPVAALGNSSEDLGSSAYANCRVVPAESPGVVAVSALGPTSTLASYSNFGAGAVDVAAPVATAATATTTAAVLSTIPGQEWFAFNGTSMASPHATGVAALIVSRFGKTNADGTVSMKPDQVAARTHGHDDRHRREGIRPPVRLRKDRRPARDRVAAHTSLLPDTFLVRRRACPIHGGPDVPPGVSGLHELLVHHAAPAA